MRNANDYTRKLGQPNWCPGCGNYGIDAALKLALARLDLNPDRTVIVSGIGCGSNLPYWSNTYGLITLHGRPLPVATGVKRANEALTVIVVAGDGDTYGIGLGHFIHSIRADVRIVCLVCNNGVYGLTKGQASPTSVKGQASPSTPAGAPFAPVNPLALALAAGGRFVARGYAGDVAHLSGLIADALQHRGFALVDVLQPCVYFNKKHSYEFYQPRIVKLDASGHNTSDLTAAVSQTSAQDEARIPIGLFYKKDDTTEKSNAVSQTVKNSDLNPLFKRYAQF